MTLYQEDGKFWIIFHQYLNIQIVRSPRGPEEQVTFQELGYDEEEAPYSSTSLGGISNIRK
ncbi:hypothetical protein BpHYR1_002916 [Brachionus plicatilis]|uniref:Uncharacterized protein n=1 Tax=Brachionus plicatilis TaxID=10195 RepID=A0A3M7QYC1_BRAPC|nr:hypothetical protein BpHYR1_002916 [Brachionus plicatilis]